MACWRQLALATAAVKLLGLSDCEPLRMRLAGGCCAEAAVPVASLWARFCCSDLLACGSSAAMSFARLPDVAFAAGACVGACMHDTIA